MQHYIENQTRIDFTSNMVLPVEEEIFFTCDTGDHQGDGQRIN
jgi:hypothetical protein